MKKIIPILAIMLFIGCSSINNQNFPSPKGNEKYVKEIIENYENLYDFLNDTNISSKFLIKDLNGITDNLYENIIKNKFQFGYKIEYIDTVKKIMVPFSNVFYYKHAIKIRSDYNKDIIWIGFTYDDDAKKWKIREFWYCNNPVEMIHFDEPCDKK
jgi:hypothetical protein